MNLTGCWPNSAARSAAVRATAVPAEAGQIAGERDASGLSRRLAARSDVPGGSGPRRKSGRGRHDHAAANGLAGQGLPTDVGSVTCNTPDDKLPPEWLDEIRPSAGRLSTALEDVPSKESPCVLPPSAGFRGLENRLYRVEIHQDCVEKTDQGVSRRSVTFKWSRDNASVVAAVKELQAQGDIVTLEVDQTGRDSELRFRTATGSKSRTTSRIRRRTRPHVKIAEVDPTTRTIKVSENHDENLLDEFPAATIQSRHTRIAGGTKRAACSTSRWAERPSCSKTASRSRSARSPRVGDFMSATTGCSPPARRIDRSKRWIRTAARHPSPLRPARADYAQSLPQRLPRALAADLLVVRRGRRAGGGRRQGIVRAAGSAAGQRTPGRVQGPSDLPNPGRLRRPPDRDQSRPLANRGHP